MSLYFHQNERFLGKDIHENALIDPSTAHYSTLFRK